MLFRSIWGWWGSIDPTGSFKEFPMGWGAAHAKDHRARRGDYYNYRKFHECRSGFRGYCLGERAPPDRWGGAWNNELNANIASNWYATNALRDIKGLRDFYGFARDHDPKYNRDMDARDASDGPSLGVYAVKPMDEVNTTDTLADENSGFPDSQRLDMSEEGGAASNQLGALARAQVYFKRPTNLWPKTGSRNSRYNNRVEHGNLYNPYWQVRLVEPTDSQRVVALAAAKGGLGSLFQ